MSYKKHSTTWQRRGRVLSIEPLESREMLTSLFVSPSGDDGNPGTLAQPFATIARGMDAAMPGDNVFLRGGTYRETITSVRSGLPGQPITVSSYNGEEVFISATDVVDGTWTETSPGSGIYSTQVSGGLPGVFWDVNPLNSVGTGATERGGNMVVTVVNQNNYTNTNVTSLTPSSAWNFFDEEMTWKIRGLDIDISSTASIPNSAAQGFFSIQTSSGNVNTTDDAIYVRYRADGNLALFTKKDAPGSWGSNVGSTTNSSIDGFDLILSPNLDGKVDYSLIAQPMGQFVASGVWDITQADWSDGGDGSTSFLQIFARESAIPNDTSHSFDLKVSSFEIVSGSETIFADHFDDGSLATVPNVSEFTSPETVTVPGETIYVSSGYDQIFVDGEMQYEARYNNKTSLDILEQDADSLTMNDTYAFTGTAFGGEADDYFAGARFNGRVDPGWSWQESVVTSSSGSTVQLDPTNSSVNWWWPNSNGRTSNTGIGYLYGKLDFLDADREWHIEHNPNGPDTLYLRVEGGADPTSHLIERKIRNWTINGSHDHIVFSGLNLRGGAVLLDGTGLVLENSDARYLSHYLTYTKGNDEDGGFPQGGGIAIYGDRNIVRSNTIYDTAGSGIVARGSNHLLTNNYIHNVGYSGSFGTGATLQGNGHTLTYNTIHDTGRSNIRPTGSGLTIMYNDLSRAGRITKDVGIIHVFGVNAEDENGKRTRIAYNWIHGHGNPDDPLSKGIYLDNYTRNFIVDHNVIWDIGQTLDSQSGIKLNSPNVGHELYHNTLIGAPSYDERTWSTYPDNNPDPPFWASTGIVMDYTAQNNWVIPLGSDYDTLFMDYANRDFRPKSTSGAIDPTTTTGLVQWQTSDGVTGVPLDFKLNMRDPNVLFTYTEVTGQGVTLPGFNDGFTGATPDSGAYEAGRPYWVPGSNLAPLEPVSLENDFNTNTDGIDLMLDGATYTGSHINLVDNSSTTNPQVRSDSLDLYSVAAPLVISFDYHLLEVGDSNHAFDIEGDGTHGIRFHMMAGDSQKINYRTSTAWVDLIDGVTKKIELNRWYNYQLTFSPEDAVNKTWDLLVTDLSDSSVLLDATDLEFRNQISEYDTARWFMNKQVSVNQGSEYNIDNLVIGTKVPMSNAGDFNNDGVVSGSDFLSWQRGESFIPNHSLDLINWERTYGSVYPGQEWSSSIVAAQTAVSSSSNQPLLSEAAAVAPLAAPKETSPTVEATEQVFDQLASPTTSLASEPLFWLPTLDGAFDQASVTPDGESEGLEVEYPLNSSDGRLVGAFDNAGDNLETDDLDTAFAAGETETEDDEQMSADLAQDVVARLSDDSE